MLATITSKGQITVPKNIRDQLHIEPGTQLDFTVMADGTISVRPLNRTALSIVGTLQRPGLKAVTVEQMNDAVEAEANERYQRASKP
ncbi:MAG: AbrB/MazE/SpoVT family DNA-binding domain-containing protein [Methyloglobulus sp.]|nr:AbrB/MazE/SpoVT family DNA-binding domain-containing protein [Methyloglobulus sp.]